MEKLGPRTRQLLASFGLDQGDIESIESGEVSWDIFDGHLQLLHSEGGQKHVRHLSEAQVQELLNAWEFERRESVRERPATFPSGEIDDWTGIRPDSDWYDLIKGYREAIEVLAKTQPRATAAPYLYLCRHALELQLKAIITLGQQSMRLSSDLPSHHDLQRLWTAAFPIAKLFHPEGESRLACVRQVVNDYHEADSQAVNFRYPVTKGNKPVEHAGFIKAFSHREHASQSRTAYDVMDAVINRLRMSALIASFPDSLLAKDSKGNEISE